MIDQNKDFVSRQTGKTQELSVSPGLCVEEKDDFE